MLWDLLRETLQETLPESEYNLWIKPLICRREDNTVIELSGPDRFFCSWVRDRYLKLMNDKLKTLDSSDIRKVVLTVAAPQQIECASTGQMRLPGVHNQKMQFRSLHPAYTFDQFMVGQSNVLARSACHALANNDMTFGNCLFINSSTGLGKSHLTQAVVHTVLDQAPATMLQYVTAQQFSAEMVNGIMNKQMDQFSQKYINHCDMLLVEDIHTLVGKNKTQEDEKRVED